MSWKQCALLGWGLSPVTAVGTYAMSGSAMLAVVEFLISFALLPWVLRFVSGEPL